MIGLPIIRHGQTTQYLGIFGIGFYAISLGGDPTIISLAVLGVAGGYNGLELSDYLALLQALQEVEVDKKD